MLRLFLHTHTHSCNLCICNLLQQIKGLPLYWKYIPLRAMPVLVAYQLRLQW
jgi:hypothetical protein